MNKEVEFWKDDIIKVDKNIIKHMKAMASENVSKKFRYCFHENEDSGMQEMLFVNAKGEYLRPHMHKEEAETQIVIEGSLYVVIFNNDGEIHQIFEASEKDCCIYRIEKKIWHMAVPISDTIIIYEVRQGSFTENTNIYPIWSPESTDMESIGEFYKKINKKIEEM